MAAASNTEPQTNGILEMVAANVLFGCIGFFVVESGQLPIASAFFRCLFAALGLGVYCAMMGLFRREYFTKQRLALMAFVGIILAGNWLLLFEAYALISIGVTTLMFNTQPFFTLLLGSLVFREQLTIKSIFWTIVAFLGVVLISQIGSADEAVPSYNMGILCALGSAMGYALVALLSRQLKAVKPHIQVFVQVSVGMVVLFPLVNFAQVDRSMASMGWLIALGFISTAMAYILLYSAYGKLKVAQLAVLSFVYPAVSVLIDYAAYGTVLSWLQMIGIALVGVSSLMITGQRTAPAGTPVVPVQENWQAPAVEAEGKVIYKEFSGGLSLVFRENSKAQLLQLLAIYRQGNAVGKENPVVIAGGLGDFTDALLTAKSADSPLRASPLAP